MRCGRPITLLAAAAGFALTATAAGALAAVSTVGAPGIGDPYYPDYGNGGYDVSHYGLGLTYQPDGDHLDGVASITARATQDLSRFNLDFLLDVSSVTVNGRSAKEFHTSGAHELVITPAQPLRGGQQMTVNVNYSGVPSTKKYGHISGWYNTPDGAVAAGEPEAAWWWYPSNDHPLDKATYDIAIQVPQGLQTVSNGVPTGSSTAGGWTTYHWSETKPQATYLTTLAIGRFDVEETRTSGGLPVITAYSRSLPANVAENARASLRRTAEVIDWESRIFGPYPFTSLGGYVPNAPLDFGALEDQTRPVYGPSVFDRGANMDVVVHENAHQWFGDSVSLRRWRDIWLNEGFATYAQWLWSEDHGGPTAAQSADRSYYAPHDDAFWQIEPGDPGTDGNNLDIAVYYRGAMALEALRVTVGDPAFFATLRDWPTMRRYGHGTIGEFIALAERNSHRRLTGLFRTWLYTPGRPATPPSSVSAGGRDGTGPRPWTATRQAQGRLAVAKNSTSATMTGGIESNAHHAGMSTSSSTIHRRGRHEHEVRKLSPAGPSASVPPCAGRSASHGPAAGCGP